MTSIYQERTRSLYQPRHSVSFTYPAPQESRITPTAVPTTEPGTAQFSFTIASSDVITPPTGWTISTQLLVIANGLNGGATTQNVSYRVKQNGTSLQSSIIATSASRYYTLQWAYTAGVNGVAPGDVITVSLWGPSGFDARYCAVMLQPVVFKPLKNDGGVVLVPELDAGVQYPALADGTMVTGSVNNTMDWYSADVYFASASYASLPGTPQSTPILVQGTSKGIWNPFMGVRNIWSTSNATSPTYLQTPYPTTFSYRPLEARTW